MRIDLDYNINNMEKRVDNKCKAFTSLEQSKKLAEILPLESADMYWDYDVQKHEYYSMIMDDQFDDTCVRAWSLAALLSIIPNYKLSSEHNYHTCTAETSFGKETVSWFDNPVDACYEIILKLNELNLL